MTIARKGFKLQVSVSILVIFSVATTLLVCAFVGYQSNQSSLISNSLDLNRINAEKLALTADEILTSAQTSLSESAGHLLTAGQDDVQFHLDLLRKSNNVFNSVFITNEEGLVLNSSPEALNVVNKKLTSEAARQALSEKRPLVSDPYVGLTGRFIILVSVPIFSANGEYSGFIGGSIYLNEPNVFETMLGTHTSNDSGSYVFVISKNGELLYHPDLARVGEKVLDNEVVQRVVTGEKGEQIVENTRGVEMLAGYAPVPTAQWGIVSQTPVPHIDAASRDLVLKIVLYSIPVIVVLLLIALLLIRYLAQPLQKLALFAEALDANQIDSIPRIHPWNYEANRLHRTMEKAVGAMQTQIHSLAQQAHNDTLTGLNNRRTMEKVLQAWSQSAVPFCYIMLDIDHFKTVNDTYGHHMGDEVLTFLGQQLMEHAGEKDVSCRFGGEEFVILTPNGNLDEAYLLAERIRKSVEQSANPIGRPITISAGVASSLDNGGDVEAVKQKADALLYKSKQEGRNRVSIK